MLPRLPLNTVLTRRELDMTEDLSLKKRGDPNELIVVNRPSLASPAASPRNSVDPESPTGGLYVQNKIG